jgi:hypothetical protein
MKINRLESFMFGIVTGGIAFLIGAVIYFKGVI